MKKGSKSINISRAEDKKLLEEGKAAYAAQANLKRVSIGEYIMHLYHTAGQAVIDQPAAALEQNLVINKEEAKVCTECDKKQSEIASLHAQVTTLETQLREKGETIPEDLKAVISHCESGQCPGHARQWGDIKAGIIEATLKNLPDPIVQSEALKRGFIPNKIVIPVRN